MKNVWGPRQGDFQPCLGGNMTVSVHFQQRSRLEIQIQDGCWRPFFRGWTLCLYWVTCLRIRAFAMAVYMRRRSIIIRAFDGNARLLAKITAVCIDIYIFLWGNLSRAIIYFSNSIKERFTNSTREFCNSLFADVRFGLTIRNKLVYV